MTTTILVALARVALAAGFGVAAYLLASANVAGWGWFLFLAFCAIPDVRVLRKDD